MEERKRRRRGNPLRTIGRIIGRIFFTLFTLCLVGACTGGIFAAIFWAWIQSELIPVVQVNADDYVMNQSSIIYYKDKGVNQETGEPYEQWLEYKILHGRENRILVDFNQIPKAMWQATVAIEDHRFFEHNGVDWKRTGGAVVNMFLSMRDTFGGSTITQQLLKNMTKDNKPYVSRKVREIFRALEFEKNYTKEEILNLYLNTIYFGKGCYGVQTAAQYYFGKDAQDLTVAECASIVAITNNPSRYGPMSDIRVTEKQSDGSVLVRTPRELNKERQEMILYRMYDPELGLNYLTWDEYNNAKNEELHFIERAGTAEEALATGEQEWNTWFMDQVFEDVANDLMSVYGIDKTTAENWIYSRGYRIYTTLDPKIQEIADRVYLNRNNLNLTSSDGQQIRSAITILEPVTGHIVAIVGDMGEKVGDRVLSYATLPRQVGSSIKPLTVYSAALDYRTVTPATILEDAPVKEVNGNPWPRNSSPTAGGPTDIQTGVRRSLNTIAIRTLLSQGATEDEAIENSYNFATERLHLNLVPEDKALASLGLGGLTYGLTTVEMAGAYGAIANSGRYNRPRTYERVETASGEPVLSSAEYHNDAMRPTTAYLMTRMLESVVESGTGTSAKFPGMHIAGKTGTTTDNYDRYFVGFTPYYVAAVWTGYKYNARITSSGNPAITMWKKVMEEIHRDLPDVDFYRPEDGLESVSVCLESGKLAKRACWRDTENSVITVEVEEGYGPRETCNLAHGAVSASGQNTGQNNNGNRRNSQAAARTATATPRPAAPTSRPVTETPRPVTQYGEVEARGSWDGDYDPEIYDPTIPRGPATYTPGNTSGGSGDSGGDSGGNSGYTEPPPPAEPVSNSGGSSGGSSGGNSDGNSGSDSGGNSGSSGNSSEYVEPPPPAEPVNNAPDDWTSDLWE